jgi:hypothetical protein
LGGPSPILDPVPAATIRAVTCIAARLAPQSRLL